MHLLSPGYAAFVALGLLPVLIHLHGRRRAQAQKLPTLLLLRASHRRVAHRTRLLHLLLLGLRVALLVAIALLLSRPFVEADSDLPSQASQVQRAVVILDDSLSMNYTPGTELGLGSQTLFERGRKRATRIVDGLPLGSEAALLLGSRGGEAPVGELTSDRTRLYSALSAVKPSVRATDLPQAVKRAAQLLSRHKGVPKRIYIVSDLSLHALEASLVPPAETEISLVDVREGKALPNCAVTDLRAEPAVHMGPRAVRMMAEVANFGVETKKNLPVTLLVDGKAVAKGLVDLQPGGRAVKRFIHILPPPRETGTAAPGSEAALLAAGGPHHLAVQIEPDALAADNERHLRLDLQSNLRVLVLDGDPRNLRRDDEAYYVEVALRPSDRPSDRDDSPLQLTTRSLDEGLSGLAEFDAVMLLNAKAQDLSRRGIERGLLEYVQKGGGLLIALGDNVEVEAYNRVLVDLLPQPLAAVKTSGALMSAKEDEGARSTQGPGEHLSQLDKRHPVLQPFLAGRAGESLLSASFARYVLLQPMPRVEGQVQVLLSFESGAPALLERGVGRGRVLLFTSTLDRDWNDLAIQPSFLPLLQHIARHLSRAGWQKSESETLIGQTREVTLAPGDSRMEVTLPSGATRMIERLSGRKQFGFGDTRAPGFYRVATAGDTGVLKPRPGEHFVVNVDATESDLTMAPASRLAALQRPLLKSSDPSGKNAKRRVELWHGLGWVLLVLLLSEALLLRKRQ
ncbi:MAG TPA: VWA domain-containing protein [Pseudomonadota bacterium]|nr:VWA domain-containing protein [Pseudomonadota bacterium]